MNQIQKHEMSVYNMKWTCPICNDTDTTFIDRHMYKKNNGEKIQVCSNCFDKLASQTDNENIIIENIHNNKKSEDSIPAQNENIVSQIIKIIAVVVIILGTILGIVLCKNQYGQYNIAIAALYIIAGFISGVVLWGFGEIISLLQKIANKK